mmetsp:Transcript_45145/g.142131  ORF Transcript_45145/g.142131 Transcript_45145/m.142131 type:complete len:200 (-) Transcript_45145:70-669(-)
MAEAAEVGEERGEQHLCEEEEGKVPDDLHVLPCRFFRQESLHPVASQLHRSALDARQLHLRSSALCLLQPPRQLKLLCQQGQHLLLVPLRFREPLHPLPCQLLPLLLHPFQHSAVPQLGLLKLLQPLLQLLDEEVVLGEQDVLPCQLLSQLLLVLHERLLHLFCHQLVLLQRLDLLPRPPHRLLQLQASSRQLAHHLRC